jgi:hypothetical protein
MRGGKAFHGVRRAVVNFLLTIILEDHAAGKDDMVTEALEGFAFGNILPCFIPGLR